MLDNGGCIASLPHLDFLKIHSALATSFRMADGGSRLNRLLFFLFFTSLQHVGPYHAGQLPDQGLNSSP